MARGIVSRGLITPGGAAHPGAQRPAVATVGALAVDVGVVPPEMPVVEVDQLFRHDDHLRCVVVDASDGPQLLSRAALERELTGRLGYGRALQAYRTVGALVDGQSSLVLDADTPLDQASRAFLGRPSGSRYDDAIVLSPSGKVRVVSVTPVFEDLNVHFEHRSMHDALTGLPNRLLLAEHVHTAVARHRPAPGSTQPALLFIDLDGFKLVNDDHGHTVGDALLKMFAHRLGDLVRPGDVVARLGGDEFAVLLTDGAHRDQAVSVAERVVMAAAAPFLIDSHVLHIGASVGVALFETTTALTRSPVEVLLQQADEAMYLAKRSGRGRAHLYDTTAADIGRDHRAGAGLLRDLRTAIDTNNLELHYQPKVTLPGGHVTGMEALLRWQHPRRGWISPAEFIPLAERTGLINDIGTWVLHRVCAQIAEWTQDITAEGGNLQTPLVAVNVSPRQLAQPNFVTEVAHILATHHVAADRLEIEITETAAIDDLTTTTTVLQGLRELGVTLSLDDYGTGYSSLTLMRELPLDCVKIDKSFVDRLDADPSAAVIVRLVIEASHSLGLTVCAEGVERVEQLEHLVALGCDTAQGYLLGVPAPAHRTDPRPRTLDVVTAPNSETAPWSGRGLVAAEIAPARHNPADA